MSTIYYIADTHKEFFAAITEYPNEKYVRHVLRLNRTKIDTYKTLHACLAAWYSPLCLHNSPIATSSHQLPYIDEDLTYSTNMYVYRHGLTSNLITKFNLPAILTRTINTRPEIDDLLDGTFAVQSDKLMFEGIIYKKVGNALQNIYVGDSFTFV